uniref:Uncharacterized protein n=2 Tax=Oryza sativa subsp. japonica TaxID=39947 RepID=Q53PR0_ORYSJ|nr:probable inactive receptor kinase At5g16590 [Oryza sativa Japonica Group]AAX95118.1 hypothetical protein LOC_Os11g06540 [Oryza sativa Japonica Group]ABA91686.1 hypothetical protein LOC_Os11g06540 [Oryza sativa Japonica Group]
MVCETRAAKRDAASASINTRELGRAPALNLSGNRLTGELLEGFFSLALLEKVDLSGMPASAFLGTTLCGALLAPCANPALLPSSLGNSKGGGKLTRGAVIGIILDVVAVLIVMLVGNSPTLKV